MILHSIRHWQDFAGFTPLKPYLTKSVIRKIKRCNPVNPYFAVSPAGFNGVNLLELTMEEGLERDGKVASEGSFDLSEAFVFLGVIDKSIFSRRELCP